MDKKSSLCALFLMILIVDSVITEKLLDVSDEQDAKKRETNMPLPIVYYHAVISHQVSNNYLPMILGFMYILKARTH